MNNCGHLVTCQHGATFCGKVNSWLRRIRLEIGELPIPYKNTTLKAVEIRMNTHIRNYHSEDNLEEVRGI